MPVHPPPNRRSVFLLALGFLITMAFIVCPPAEAAVLFSVDVNRDLLVTVDTSDGSVQVVGAIGRDVAGAALAIHDGTLYLMDPVSTGAELVTLDPATGAMLTSVVVTINGQPGVSLEGMCIVGGQLVASTKTAGNAWQSNSLGYLSVDGALTGLHDYRSFDASADCDAMCGRPDGHLFWVDVRTSNYALINAGPPSAPSYQVLGTPSPSRPINDVAMVGEDLWGIDHTARSLIRLNPANGSVLESQPYLWPTQLVGLADGSSAPSQTATFYSIDGDTDQLVHLSAADGSVTVVGDINAEVDGGGLVLNGGVLYLLDNVYGVKTDILALSVFTGQVLSFAPVTVDGSPVVQAEALAMVDGRLLASVAIGPEYWQSNRLGELSLDGSVSGLHDYTVYDPLADCDAMCERPDGHVFWIDVDPDENNYRMIDATPPDAPSYTVVGTHFMRRLNDGALIDGQLWFLDWEDVQLLRLDQTDGSLLGVKPLDTPDQLSGLACGVLAAGVGDGLIWDGASLALHSTPNPFRHSTTIQFELASPVRVDAAVYDILGRKVTDLFHGGRGPGQHALAWRGTDDRGRLVTPGVYFLKVCAEGRSARHTLVFIR